MAAETIDQPKGHALRFQDVSGSPITLTAFDPLYNTYSVGPTDKLLYNVLTSTPGDLGRCLKSQRINFYPTAQFSVSVWLKTSSPGVGTIFNWYTEAKTQYDSYGRTNLALMNGGRQLLYRSSMDEEIPSFNNDLSADLAGPLSPQEWHHYVLSFDVSNAQLVIYVDLSVRSTAIAGASGQALSSYGYLFVGGAPIDDPFSNWANIDTTIRCNQFQSFPGSLSDFMVFSQTLSPTEVQTLYNLDTVPADLNLRFATAPIATRAFRPSDWVDPTSVGGLNKSPRLYFENRTSSAPSRVTLAFSSRGGNGDLDVAFSRFVASNRTWTPPVRHNTFIGDDLNPFFSQCGSNYVLVFSSYAPFVSGTGSDTDIWFSTSPDGVGNWSFPALLNSNAKSDTTNDDQVVMVFQGGVATAVWTSPESDTVSRLKVSRSTDNCHSWSTTLNLNTDSDSVDTSRRNPTLFLGATNLLLTYVKRPGSASLTDSEIGFAQTPVNPSFFCVDDTPSVDLGTLPGIAPNWIRDSAIAKVPSLPPFFLGTHFTSGQKWRLAGGVHPTGRGKDAEWWRGYFLQKMDRAEWVGTSNYH